jgi:thioredoxin reductase
MQVKKVTIIGAGPAGIATAIQLKRYGIEPVLLEKNRIGGLLLNANLVENYPGFPDGIPGPELIKLFEAQLKTAGVPVNFEEVSNLDYEKDFIVKTSERELCSRITVIASGTKPKKYDSSDIPQELAHRIFYEIYPIAGIRDKKVIIVGAGDAAFDYALKLGKRNEISILNRSERKKSLPVLRERVHTSPKIRYRENVTISRIGNANNGLFLECNISGEKRTLQADYILFAIGRASQTDYFTEKLRKRAPELKEEGLLYFVGDVQNAIYRQTAIAVGNGIQAAMKICADLKEAN